MARKHGAARCYYKYFWGYGILLGRIQRYAIGSCSGLVPLRVLQGAEVTT